MYQYGESNSNCKYSELDVYKITKYKRQGMKQKDIALKIGCSQSRVSEIVRGKARILG